MKSMNRKKGFSHAAGDFLERCGEFIHKVGATSLGRKIYDAGNKLEHKNDRAVTGTKANRSNM